MFNKYPYNLFNQEALAEYDRFYKELKDIRQNEKIEKMVNSVKELIETSREVEPEYREKAFWSCMDELIRQSEIERQLNKNW
ncbi:MAG: hypothetical protein IJ376_00195 [Acidaminococcaceae bacterium]|nr:hypothetical protein [Acidaminococcaceae bacterium]